MIFQIQEQTIFLNQSFRSKEDLFSFIGAQALRLGITQNQSAVVSGLQERERMGSTLVADGVALPHARDIAILQLAVFVISNKHSISYNEEGEAHLFFVLLAPLAANNQFIESLSKIAHIIMDEEIRSCICTSDKKSLIDKIEKILIS